MYFRKHRLGLWRKVHTFYVFCHFTLIEHCRDSREHCTLHSIDTAVGFRYLPILGCPHLKGLDSSFKQPALARSRDPIIHRYLPRLPCFLVAADVDTLTVLWV